MVPTYLVAGLVLGLVFARSCRMIGVSIAVTACVAGITVAVGADHGNVPGVFSATLVALINLSIGALVGRAVRRRGCNRSSSAATLIRS